MLHITNYKLLCSAEFEITHYKLLLPSKLRNLNYSNFELHVICPALIITVTMSPVRFFGIPREVSVIFFGFTMSMTILTVGGSRK